MVFCSECGTQNPEGAIFCSECGKNLPKPQTNDKSVDNNKSLDTRLGYFKGRTHLTNNMPFDLEITSESLILHNKGTFGRKKSKKVKIYLRAKMSNIKFGKHPPSLRFTYDGKLKILAINKEYVNEIKRLLKKKRLEKKIPPHLKKVPHQTVKWDTIDNNDAIKKMEESPHHFYIDVFGVVEEAPKNIITDHPGRRAGATLLGGILFGPIGAMTGYAATSGVDVVQTDPTTKTVKERIYMKVSVHEKGIKMIKGLDRSKIYKIPWNRIKTVIHDNESITIESPGQEKLTFNGDITAIKGLYLITKASISGLEEEDEGWK